MQWKYCGFCGNLGIKKKDIDSKLFVCPRCNWEGIPSEADIQTVNSKARTYTPGTKWNPPAPSTKEETTDKEDQENNNNTNLERNSSKVPKNNELLKRIKDKNYGDAEFM